jgi:1-acyl-sn-glycerol-3-phosphate acyltransferase
MKKRSIKYELVRIYVRFAFWLSHSKITVEGRKNIPKDKPVIFAPNHQNALMDPLALVCTNKLQTVWLARADIFKSKTFRVILNFLKIWPVYRIRDGKENLSNNEDIFAKVIQLLENRQSVALFPEAAHSGKRQMLPHKKAIPRIALEAEEKNEFQLNLQIVPVGISYSHYWKFNRSLLVQYGEPIPIDNFWVDYDVNPQKAMLDLRDQIHEKLRRLVIDIPSQKYYREYESMRLLAAKTYATKKFFGKNKALQLFRAEKELIANLETLETQSPDEFNVLIVQLQQYESEIEKAGFNNRQIENTEKAHRLKTSAKLAFALATLPVFVSGLLFNGIPFIVSRAITIRKVKDRTFLSSINFVLGLIIYPVFYLAIYFMLLQPRFSGQISLLLLILMPFLGKATYWLLQFYGDVALQTLYLAGRKKYKWKIGNLIKKRRTMIELILNKVNF